MLNIKQRKERAFDSVDITSEENVFNYLKTFLYNKPLSIKYAPEAGDVVINEFLDDGSVMIVTNPEFKPGENFTLYGLHDKYFEIDLQIAETRGPGYFRCTIDNLKRAAAMRKEVRFKLTPQEVYATNFKISKHTIELTNYSIPTSIKVLLDQFQSKNAGLSDIIKVGILNSDDRVLKHIKKTGETLFIPDISNPESYKALNDDFVDVVKLMGDDFGTYMKKNLERSYKSMIISPIIYLTETEKSIPFAYISLISKKKEFTLENVLEVKDHIFTLIDRIRDANTILLQVRQEIPDISKNGAKLKITDQNLKKYIIRSRGFVFDIVFRLQAPITIYGDVTSTYTDDMGHLYVGVSFAGNSSREDEMKRFHDIIDPMIKEYKSRLIKERKVLNK